MGRSPQPALPVVVALTDDDWFRSFARPNEIAQEPEVNFWRPGQMGFRSLPLGAPFFFRLKSHSKRVAGFGFYSETVRLPLRLTWELFQTKNGASSYEHFMARLHKYRARLASQAGLDAPVVSILLRDAVFLPDGYQLSWTERDDWKPHTMTWQKYDMSQPPGTRLRELLDLIQAVRPDDLSDRFQIPQSDARERVLREQVTRVGQGTFRARLLSHYGRCAVTGEHSLPVLEAAHITPYQGPASNHVQNGLVLRADVHRLFDEGYVTITPRHEFLVSKRLRDEWDNGRAYYALQGREIQLPGDRASWPSTEALEWHAESCFKK